MTRVGHHSILKELQIQYIDLEDNELSGDTQDKLSKYKKQGRPYLVSAGIEDGIRYIFTMSPFMAKIASEAEL